MLVFDLSHDRMARVPLAMPSNVQHAVIAEKARYAKAARGIGLTPREFDELQRRAARGEIERTTLPVHLDAMAGMHRDGRIYAIRDVRVLPHQSAYVIGLDDGKRVYVPVVCGNLSVLQGTPRPSARRALARRILPPPSPNASAKNAGPASADTAIAASQLLPAAATASPSPAIADLAPALIAPGSAASPARPTGFHLPLGWIAGAFGAIGAFWSAGGSSDACS